MKYYLISSINKKILNPKKDMNKVLYRLNNHRTQNTQNIQTVKDILM